MTRVLFINTLKRRFLAAVVLAMAAAIFNPSFGQAHANLLRSDPADGASLAESPQELRLWFDEPISPRFSSVQLFDVNSQPIEITSFQADPGDPTLLVLTLPELPEGIYSVLYKVLSDSDGHFSQGLLVFGVGDSVNPESATAPLVVTPAPPPQEVLLRWLNFSSLAGLIGALAVIQLVLAPVEQASNHPPQIALALRKARRRVFVFAGWCGGIALIVGVGLLVWQTVSLMATLPEGVSFNSTLWQVLSRTRWGAMWLLRQLIYILLIINILFLIRASQDCEVGEKTRPTAAPHKNLARPITILLSLSLLAVQAFSGHASGLSTNTALALIIDMLHLSAASMWVGGLLALAIGLLPVLRENKNDFVNLVYAGWKPFSLVAALSVGTLFATGFYNTGRQVASVDALLTTQYGQVLIGKVGLVLGVGAIGLLNSMLLHPKIAAPVARLIRRPPGWTPLPLHRLPALVMVEGSLGLVVVFLTGLVTASPAPRNSEFTVVPEEVPGALSQNVDDMVITLEVKPNRPGQNVFTVFTRSTRRPPPAEIARVILRFENQEQATGRVSVTAEEIEPDRYVAGGNHLSLAGNWRVDVVVRRLGMEDSVAQFNWIVAPPGKSRPVVISKAPLEAIMSLTSAILLLLISLAAFALFWTKTHPSKRPSVRDVIKPKRSNEDPGELRDRAAFNFPIGDRK